MHLRRRILMAGALAALARITVAAETVDFNRDIRPILSDNCFKCHGPDAHERKADLRLDTQTGALADLEGKHAVAPGKPAESELYKRIISQDADERMPPADSGKQLTPEQIERLRTWIEQGAVWGVHWAFVAPQRPAVPAVKQAGWVRTPVDAFILSRLERAGLEPSAEADKVTLLRRLSLDLVGLPPSIEEVDAFLADESPAAYESQVERLLASPHYGERFGRQWLDAARYADSDGYEKDKPRFVWFYRDWVVGALNRDLPYDQFIIEQIAGDQLPAATQDQRVATGFLRNSMINEEGGVDPEQFRMEAMFDRMDAIGKGILGLTIQCAQCHSHKFDPLTHTDYYRLFAFLNNDCEAAAAVYTPEQLQKRADLFRGIADVEAQLQHQTPDWPQRMAAWEQTVRDNQPEWVVVTPEIDDISTGGQKYLPQMDGSLLAQGYAPTKHKVKLTVRTRLENIQAFRLELLCDANLPLNGPGRSIFGTGALTQFDVEAAPADAPDKNAKVAIARATADVDLAAAPLAAMYDDRTNRQRVTGPIGFALDGKEETAWGIDVGPGRRNQPRKAVFNAATPIANPAGSVLTFYVQQSHGGWNSDDNQNCNLGRIRLSVTTAANAVADPLPQNVRDILLIPAAERTAAQTAAVFAYWRTTVPEWREAGEKIEALWREHPEPASQLVLAERSDPRGTQRLERGDFLKPAEAVTPGVPSFLHALPEGAPPTRLSLARWLVDRKSPTAARSIVNRIWQSYFGSGLVSTSEDLGLQSETPSHPELLDWLAVELMDRGWSLKALHRLIVTSAAYRQSSRMTPELVARDPYNRLLARGPRMRVEAEAVRDIALAASGLLNRKLGGPSVHPPAPEFLFQKPASYGPKVWQEEAGGERYRRALYTFRYRSVPYPALQTFDAPNGDFSCVRRSRSNTPLQALVTLNEPLFLECARALALETLTAPAASDADRVTYAFRRCLARKPNESETAALLGLLERQVERFSQPGQNPWELAAADPAKTPRLPEGSTAAQLAAWTATARVILNLDETITKE
jgi:mono/diheme cytochrome c family protein